MDIAIVPYSIYQFQDFFLYFTLQVNPRTYNPGGVAATSNGLQHQKRQLALFLSNFLDKGVIQKITAVDTTVASTGILLLFPSFSFLFCLDKDANHLLPV